MNANHLEKRPITLVLSGGGFRATLFHLGVIRSMAERGLLEKITQVFAVSGGSIIAAHLLLNWKSYQDVSGEGFGRCASQLIAFCQKDIRGRIIRRWTVYLAAIVCLFTLSITIIWRWSNTGPFFWLPVVMSLIAFVILIMNWGASPIGQFERELDGLYQLPGGRHRVLRLVDLGRDQPSPRIGLIATNLNSGTPWVFSQDGYYFWDKNSWKRIANELCPITKAVAASAAFPPLFSPVKIKVAEGDNDWATDQFLSDGGVFDNLGVDVANRAPFNISAESTDVVVSSAEKLFAHDNTSRFTLLPKRAYRTTDVLMNQLSAANVRAYEGRYLELRRSDEESRQFLPIALQRRVRCIRTDLDEFSNQEVQLLYFKGYVEANGQLGQKSQSLDSFIYDNHIPVATNKTDVWLPFRASEINPGQDAESLLQSSHETKLKLFDIKDALLSFEIICLLAFVLLANPISSYFLQRGYNWLPGYPATITGQWLDLSNMASVALAKQELGPHFSFIDKLLNPPPGESVKARVFLSHLLSEEYVWRPHGEFAVVVSDEEIQDIYSFLVADSSEIIYLKRLKNAGSNEIHIIVPPGRPNFKICIAIVPKNKTFVPLSRVLITAPVITKEKP